MGRKYRFEERCCTLQFIIYTLLDLAASTFECVHRDLVAPVKTNQIIGPISLMGASL
jgi:hypothetical protein